MRIFVIPAILGALFGFLLSFSPYGKSIFIFSIAATSLFMPLYFFNNRFRESDAGTRTFFIFIFTWLVIGIYHFEPKGTHSYLPPMELENVKVRYFIEVVRDINPNIDFNCPDEILDRQLDLYTITPITIRDAIKILDKRVGTEHSYARDYSKASIARGPRVTVTLKQENSILHQLEKLKDEEAGKPFYYDAF